MTSDTLNDQLYKSILQFNEAEKESILNMLKTFLTRKDSGRTTIDHYNVELDEALTEVESGNYISQDELENIIGK